MADRMTVVGRIGQEPLAKVTPKGEVVEFSLAATARVLGPDGVWSDGDTTWYRVSAWGRLGSNAIGSLHKGQPVIAHGQVWTHEWTGRDGQTRSELRMKAAALGHDLTGGTSTFAKRYGQPAAAAPNAAETTAAGQGHEQEQEQEQDQPERTGDWGALEPEAPRPPAPAGWSTTTAVEGDPPF